MSLSQDDLDSDAEQFARDDKARKAAQVDERLAARALNAVNAKLNALPFGMTKEQIRTAYHDARRAAAAMRTDAAGFRAIAESGTAQPETYGAAAGDYAAGVAARYGVLAHWCDSEAEKQERVAEGHRANLVHGDGAA